MQDVNAPTAMRDFQLTYGKYLRDPEKQELPQGIPPRRSEIYEGLLIGNVSNFIDKCFPVTRSFFEESQWKKLVRSFYREWRCENPIFNFIPYEFVRYIAETDVAERLPPWLAELLHYEWVELEVDLGDFEDDAFVESLPKNAIYLSPALKLLAYQWPVHRISKEFQPDVPQETCLAVYRDSSFNVRFTELNATTYTLLQYIQSNPGDEENVLAKFGAFIQHPQPNTVIEFGKKLVEDFIQQEILFRS